MVTAKIPLTVFITTGVKMGHKKVPGLVLADIAGINNNLDKQEIKFDRFNPNIPKLIRR